jgi:hypothetical protein
MVRKQDGSWQPFSMYSQLNLVTIPDADPLPNMMDFAAKMSSCTIFSKVDLRKGYRQIPKQNYICKTAIITPFSLYAFSYMEFCLPNAGNSFQGMMDHIAGCMAFIFIYLDDITVGSRDIQSHIQHLHFLFESLWNYCLVINREKCEFGVQGWISSATECPVIILLGMELDAIFSHPSPGSCRSFRGSGNIELQLPVPARSCQIPQATDGGGKMTKESSTWTADSVEAFTDTKEALSKAAQLAHPSPGAEIG